MHKIENSESKPINCQTHALNSQIDPDIVKVRSRSQVRSRSGPRSVPGQKTKDKDQDLGFKTLSIY